MAWRSMLVVSPLAAQWGHIHWHYYDAAMPLFHWPRFRIHVTVRKKSHPQFLGLQYLEYPRSSLLI
ncbi:hypothetical protein N7508_000371 [Penicillium antarcticum]|uniref:uncharacterized protein n=1 Tax=Penicillium antarcticum TaxID=416450 RepID=UPI00238D99F1|nr:uncharacterized protein N7508_000371 [Penicillium antarcticum]KAJ5320088.1 hypothetical protein N7508_000371 [Penicillium antarcticum]